jgi:hypothetical protein
MRLGGTLDERFGMKKFVLLAVAIVGSFVFAGTAQAASWNTIATTSDRSTYSTYAWISKSDVRATSPLRTFVRAPRGRTEVSGYVFCWDPSTYDYASRNFAWSYWSSGRIERWKHRVPTLGYSRCDVSLDFEGRGGYLTAKLQRYA